MKFLKKWFSSTKEAPVHHEDLAKIQPIRDEANQCMQQEEWDLALEGFLKILQLKPNDLEAHFRLAWIYFIKKDKNLARQHIDQALLLKPNFKEAAELRDLITGEEHFNQAVELMKQGIEAMKIQKMDEAVQLFEHAIDIFPNLDQGYYNLALAYTYLDEIWDAIFAYRKAIEINNDLIDAHFNLATLYVRIGQIDEAKKTYEEALRLDPDDDEIKQRIAELERLKN